MSERLCVTKSGPLLPFEHPSQHSPGYVGIGRPVASPAAGVGLVLAEPSRVGLDGFSVFQKEHPDRVCGHLRDEIRRFIEADSLAYLSMDALRRSVADDRDEYCYACYTGRYPTDFINIEQLVRAGKKAGG